MLQATRVIILLLGLILAELLFCNTTQTRMLLTKFTKKPLASLDAGALCQDNFWLAIQREELL